MEVVIDGPLLEAGEGCRKFHSAGMMGHADTTRLTSSRGYYLRKIVEMATEFSNTVGEKSCKKLIRQLLIALFFFFDTVRVYENPRSWRACRSGTVMKLSQT
jgi:hypothetical protein